MLVKTFGWPMTVTVAGLALAGLLWGWQGLAVVAILSVLEISLSFDNAVINAGILRRLNAFWQKVFLTVGVLIAVFGMRLVFPLAIVAVTAKIGPVEAVNVAVHDPDRYQSLVIAAHPAIAAFGGVFLLMIFLDFVLEDRDIAWLGWLERPLARLGKLETLSVVVALVALVVAATTVGTFVHKTTTVLLAGVAGLITYLVVGGVSGYFEGTLEESEEAQEAAAEAEGAEAAQAAEAAEGAAGRRGEASAIGLAGKAALFLFLYLEVIDASFSFDGVIGAFAITNQIFMMALGLGIGAVYIRSLTVFLVRKGTLDDYVYLEHGAHYAIGALALILLATIKYEINELITGLVGVVLILAAFWSSVIRNRRLGEGCEQVENEAEIPSGV
ncbi:DUF475 domain-containing protein [Streptomyces sp. RB6PN25]|uniref:DUF475 domain-containing protein n=1 Tax=Streptomyces humicola TaxID=2953240 RepID=A0ABT1PWP0_9ACTN|nr:DUF475 domain-containing protein [Streptomyces humicola]MCQ4082094.1 DUF475 domain-containing protein [Streptomyces humicola]